MLLIVSWRHISASASLGSSWAGAGRGRAPSASP